MSETEDDDADGIKGLFKLILSNFKLLLISSQV
jgi:hypothetical protein